jgi:hypothetical protein
MVLPGHFARPKTGVINVKRVSNSPQTTRSPEPFGVPSFRIEKAPDGKGKIITFTLHVPSGYHAIGPELDRNDG